MVVAGPGDRKRTGEGETAGVVTDLSSFPFLPLRFNGGGQGCVGALTSELDIILPLNSDACTGNVSATPSVQRAAFRARLSAVYETDKLKRDRGEPCLVARLGKGSFAR